MAVSAFLQIREAQQQTGNHNNFRVVGMALANFNPISGRLPKPTYYDPDTLQPLTSWRYHILPVWASYKRETFFDLAWNHPKNSYWLGAPHPYAPKGWTDGVLDTRPPNQIPTITNVYAITGEDTAFGNGLEIPPQRLEDLPRDLILVAEIENSGHHWMRPGDFEQGKLEDFGSKSNLQISGVHASGIHILFADQEVWLISNSTPFDSLSKFFTISSATQSDRNEILADYRIR